MAQHSLRTDVRGCRWVCLRDCLWASPCGNHGAIPLRAPAAGGRGSGPQIKDFLPRSNRRTEVSHWLIASERLLSGVLTPYSFQLSNEEYEDNNKLVLSTKVHTPNSWQCFWTMVAKLEARPLRTVFCVRRIRLIVAVAFGLGHALACGRVPSEARLDSSPDMVGGMNGIHEQDGSSGGDASALTNGGIWQTDSGYVGVDIDAVGHPIDVLCESPKWELPGDGQVTLDECVAGVWKPTWSNPVVAYAGAAVYQSSESPGVVAYSECDQSKYPQKHSYLPSFVAYEGSAELGGQVASPWSLKSGACHVVGKVISPKTVVEAATLFWGSGTGEITWATSGIARLRLSSPASGANWCSEILFQDLTWAGGKVQPTSVRFVTRINAAHSRCYPIVAETSTSCVYDESRSSPFIGSACEETTVFEDVD